MAVITYPYNENCPICNYPNAQHERVGSYDGLFIQCKTCGRFKISGSTFDSVELSNNL